MAEITGRVGWRNYVSPTSATNPLWNSLVAYYTGDNTPNDAKGTANGTLVNGATYSTGKINNGFSLDGVNDYVSIPNGTFNPTSGSYTISAWMSLSYNSYLPVIFGLGSFTNNSIVVYVYGGLIRFLNSNGATYQLIESPLPSLGVLHHVLCVKDTASNKYYLYVNGSLVAQATISINYVANSLETRIGSIGNGAHGFSPFAGIIDEVGLWNRALTATEAAELYNGGAGKQYVAPAPTSIITTGLVMNLDASNALSYAGTGTTWTDLSGSGNNGTLVNGVGYSSTNGGTMVFDGINDMVSVAHSPNLNSTKITVSMWIKFGSSLSTDKVLFSKGSEGSRTYWFYENNGVYFAYGGFTGRIPAEILVNQWCNIVGVQTSTASLIYLNGVLYSSGAGAASITTTQGIGINSYSSNIYHASAKNIPQVAIYNRDLSASEVATNFAALKSRYGL